MVITRLPARSRSNTAGAKAASEARAVVPLLPEFASMLTCTRLFSAVAVLPMKKSRLRALAVSVFLNRISVMTDAFVSPVKSNVAVFIAKPDGSFTAMYVDVLVAKTLWLELLVMGWLIGCNGC